MTALAGRAFVKVTFEFTNDFERENAVRNLTFVLNYKVRGIASIDASASPYRSAGNTAIELNRLPVLEATDL